MFPYLPENPNAKMVARSCSTEKISVALADSVGFAYQFPCYAKHFKTPSDKFFFAKGSKCGRESEQYWIVPEGSRLEYDEMISVEKVEVKRWLATDFDKQNHQAAANDPNRPAYASIKFRAEQRIY